MKYSFFLSFLYIVTLCSCSSHLIGPLMEQYDPIEIYDEFWTYVDEETERLEDLMERQQFFEINEDQSKATSIRFEEKKSELTLKGN